MIESNYLELLKAYRVDKKSAKELWSEINTNYSKKNRHYHNLKHLGVLLGQLTEVKDQINNWKVILFTLYYHDIIYYSTKNNNEERSADLASKRMTEIGVNEIEIKLCFEQIMATKTHVKHSNADTNIFIDADLSILGREPRIYKIYCENIRKEYAIYPNFLYNKGRKKVIKHFLSMDRIFKTEAFYSKFESQAKLNLECELGQL